MWFDILNTDDLFKLLNRKYRFTVKKCSNFITDINGPWFMLQVMKFKSIASFKVRLHEISQILVAP